MGSIKYNRSWKTMCHYCVTTLSIWNRNCHSAYYCQREYIEAWMIERVLIHLYRMIYWQPCVPLKANTIVSCFLSYYTKIILNFLFMIFLKFCFETNKHQPYKFISKNNYISYSSILNVYGLVLIILSVCVHLVGYV